MGDSEPGHRLDAPVGRDPCLRDERWRLEDVRYRATPRRPLAPFDAWIEGQDLPVHLATPAAARSARDAARRLWAIAAPWLERGLRVKHYPGHRVVTVLGRLQFRVTDHGRHVEGAARGLGSDRLLTGNLPIEAPLRTWGFAATLLGDATPHHHERAQATRRWAERALDRYLHRLVDLRAIERWALAAMDLDPDVLRMARRIGGAKRQGRDVDTALYHSFRGLLPALLEVERLAPALTPLAWATRHQWSRSKVPPLQYLRNMLGRRSVGPEGWRRLRASSPRPVWAHWTRHCIAGPDALLDFMADWARVHQGLPLTTRMPWVLWDTLARTSVEAGHDRLLPPVVWPCRPAVLRDALARWSAAGGPAARRAFVEGDWTRVVRWSAHYGGSVPAGRKTSWRAVLAAASRDERLRRAEAVVADARWPTPIEAFVWGGIRVVPLVDPVALVDEAIALRHCADTLQAACVAGQAHVFGFRDARTGRRFATLALRPVDGTIEIHDLRGLANRPPRDEEEAVADEVVERIRSALKRR